MENQAVKGLKTEEIKVLGVLQEADKLSRSHLTIGPLRHLKPAKRKQIYRNLKQQELIEEIPIKRPMGAPAVHFRITEAGREAYRISQEKH